MRINNINSTNTIYNLSQELTSLEKDLNANLLDEIGKIALVPRLKNMLREIEAETIQLETKLQILKDDTHLEPDLLSLKKVKDVWQRVYHRCIGAQLSSLPQICNKTEIDSTTLNKGQFIDCPNEILLNLLSFLSIKDLINLTKCSTFFHSICQNDSIWKDLLQREFPFVVIPDNKSAKEICIFSQKIEKSLGDLLKKGSYTCSTLIKLDDVTCLRKYDNLIFYGCRDKTIRAWDLTTNQCIITLETQQNFVDCLYKEDNLLFSGLRNGIIQVWDLTTNQFTALRGHQDRVVSLRKAGNRLFSGSSDNTIKVWDLTTNQCTTTFPNFERGIAQTDNIVFAGYRQVIKMWDLNTNQFFANFGEHKDTVRCLHIKDHLLFSGSDDGIVKIWDLGSARCIATLAEKIDDGDEYTGIVCFHVEGDLLFSGSWNGAIKVWDLTTNQCLATLAGHGYPIAFLHKKGNRLFSGANDGTIKVWDFLIPPPEDKNLYEGYKNALGKGLQTLWERVKKTYYNN